MRASFFDRNMHWLYDHEGEVKGGSFVWRTSTVPFPLNHFMYKEEKVQCDIAKCLRRGATEAFYIQDGEKYTQITFDKVSAGEGWMNEYIMHYQNAELQKAMILVKPSGLLEQLKWIAYAALAIMIVGTAIMSSNMMHEWNVGMKPFNETAQSCVRLMQVWNSTTPKLIHVLNQTSNFYAAHGVS